MMIDKEPQIAQMVTDLHGFLFFDVHGANGLSHLRFIRSNL